MPRPRRDFELVVVSKTSKMTLAMKAGIAECPMTVEDIVEMLPLPVAKKCWPNKKRAV